MNNQDIPRQGGVGGSSQLKPRRKFNGQKKNDRDENTQNRLISKLGSIEKVNEVRDTFAALENHRKPVGCVHDTADGYIVSLINLNFSNREIRGLVGVGGSRTGRVRKELADPTLRAKKLQPKIPSHAFNDEDKSRVKDQIASWNARLEDGFACSHRRQMRHFIEENAPSILQ
jgi:hypothetical protein